MSSLHSLLIVDDERVIREGLSSMVNWADLGFEVAAVLGDGREALGHLANHAVDAILTDIRMTFVSGLDLAREVRENLSQTRVVLLSGHREFELAQQAVAAGVYGYLLKPVDFAELRVVFSELANLLTRERDAEEAARRELESRNRERQFLLQQFFERVLTDGDIGRRTIEERYRRLGESQSLAGRPCAIVSATAARRERHPLLPDSIGILLAGREEGITYTQIVIDTLEVEGLEQRRFLAHANVAMEIGDFVSRLTAAAGETVSGLGQMLGLTVHVAVDHAFEDLLAAVGCANGRRAVAPQQGAAQCSEGEHERLTSQPNRLITSAKHFLVEHYREPIGLTETASALGVSPPYLSRLFHAHADMTLIDYLTKLRIERAGELLAAGTQSVAEIAAEVGYASASHFSRLFKKVSGVPPADYRRRGSASGGDISE